MLEDSSILYCLGERTATKKFYPIGNGSNSKVHAGTVAYSTQVALERSIILRRDI